MIVSMRALVRISLLVTVLLGSACTNIAIRTAVEIEAPAQEVYATLADFDAYPQWNPYHRRVDGEFREGAALTIHVVRPDGKEVEVPPHMIRIEENREITWGGGIRGIFYGVHRFLLEPVGARHTFLRHDEDFSGIAVGFADLPPDVIAEGYHQMNMALKQHLESRNQIPESP